MTILCNLANINLAFGEKILFNDAKLTINKADRIGLIGLNGHGKSTLFNILSGKQTPDISTPPFIFDKNKDFTLFLIPQELDVKSFPELDINNFWISFYPDLYDTWKELKVVEEKLIENYEDESLLHKQTDLLEAFDQAGGWQIESSYQSYLGLFGLNNRETLPLDLSGGEQRKMALSIGLSAPHEFILWDEPTNHLDIETIETFEDELLGCQKTFMIISHDRYLLNHVTNRIVHIERGEINTFQGTYLTYLEHLEEKEKELAKNLSTLENKHRRELAWMRQGIKARGTRSKKRVEGFENIKKDIAHLKSRARKSVELDLSHSGRKTKILVQISDGEFGYNQDVLLKELNLIVAKKDKIALIGPNGAGKSTLLKIISGDLSLNKGNIKTPDEFKVIRFDQKRSELDESKTLFEAVGAGQDFVHLADGSRKHIMSYLENFLFHRNQINRPISTLSGGEKNRLQLAMFMSQSADLWIFDEPTNDLDIETIELLEAELKNYDAPVIIVGHDRAFLDNICKSTWLVHEKKIEVFEGGYSQVAPYLHALELEKANQSTRPKTEEKPKTVGGEKESSKKPSLKDQKRFEEVEQLISEVDDKIIALEEKLSAIDYSSEDAAQDAQDLQKEIQTFKNQSEKLMSEWEELAEKMN
ncbi:MAG: hypothetical protein CME62_05300 [Halobacteriovoraceae bacterium]|nr:hypothetical protein [Halobacteriovoraceae bacterium]|tara:strand:- start:1377 stop:3314 length:1938 start_codon:yes stop_codon:yes gene_type:complete